MYVWFKDLSGNFTPHADMDKIGTCCSSITGDDDWRIGGEGGDAFSADSCRVIGLTGWGCAGGDSSAACVFFS
jgi:hypothetical protein